MNKKIIFFAKSALIGLLVFGGGAGSVFADGAISATPTPTAEISPSPTPTLSTGVTVSPSPTSTPIVSPSTTPTDATPSFLPGDFFYFIKAVYEKIQLAITFNDINKAKLLTEFAQERLAESNALLAKGEAEKSQEILQKSLENQLLAVEKVDAQDDVTLENKNPEQVVKVKTDLQHNITALTAALEKAENPKAQAAIMKNIEKSFGHLEKKLAKLEKKGHSSNENDVVFVPTSSPTPIPVSSLTPVPTVTPSVASATASSPVPSSSVQPNTAASVIAGSEHEDVNEDKKQEKQVKQEKANNVKTEHENNGKGSEKNSKGK